LVSDEQEHDDGCAFRNVATRRPLPSAVRDYLAKIGAKAGKKHNSLAGGRAVWTGVPAARRDRYWLCSGKLKVNVEPRPPG
jgi:hypothetical protein